MTLFARWSITVIMLIGVAMTSGCRRPQAPASENAKDEKEPEARQLLTNVIGLLTGESDPGTYRSAIEQLNNYVERRPDSIGDLSEGSRQQVTDLFGAPAASFIAQKKFTEEDLDYLRNAFFIRNVASRLAQSGSKGPVLAQEALTWVDRNVPLIPPDWEVALPPADAIHRALGGHEERLWAFLELLRQSDMQGVVIAAHIKGSSGPPVPWLAGLVDGERILLYDPLLGLEVLGPDGKSQATLNELVADPTLALRDYEESPGVIPPSVAIDKLSTLLLMDAPMFAPRLAFVQSMLTGAMRVNLTVDSGALAEAAKTALKSAGGVELGTWMFPYETRRAAVIRRQQKVAQVSWLAPEDKARQAYLRGELASAVEQLVSRDLQQVSSIQHELLLRQVNVSLPIRRLLMGRLRPGQTYLTAMAQWAAQPDDPAVALEWFDRYLAEFSSPELEKRDILEEAKFARLLVGEEGKPAPPLAARLTEKLQPRVRELLQKAAKDKVEAEIVAPLTTETLPQVKTSHPLSLAELEEVIADMNRVLADAELFPAGALTEGSLGTLSPFARMMVHRPSAEMTPAGVIWRNRLIFDAILSEQIVPMESPWLAAVVKGSAEIQKQLGQEDAALTRLDADYPSLAGIQSAGLKALAARWRRATPQP